MIDSLKAKVLAKCGELAHTECEFGDYHVSEMYDCLCLESMDGVDDDEEKVQTLWLGESLPADHWVWAAAAQILGIANPETRPFDHEAHASEAMDQLIAEIGSDFDTSVLYTVKKLLKAYRSEPISIGVDYNAYSRASAMMATEPLTRHSDGLLWEAWRTASEFNFKDDFEKTDEEDAFNEWLSTLPPDPLADDRATLRKHYEHIIPPCFDFAESEAFYASYKRLAGMEVGNVS